MDVISNFAARYERTREEEISIEDYLAECKRNPLAYASAAERMLKAIGEPKMVDTRNDPRLSRIFANKVIKVYPAFAEFYGMEDAIEQVVSYFRHAAQGLEEKKQILYLLGPVGGGKSSIAERLKQLMQEMPFYAIKGSPVNESPLGLFDPAEDGPVLEKEFGIPARYLNRVMSPWAVKRLEEYGGDIRRFKVVKRYPSILKQVGIAKTEPGDENNQDISALVGKVDIRKLETFAQDDPEPGDVAAEFLQALDRPRAHDGAQVVAGDAVVFLEDGAILMDIEQAERRFVYRRALDGVERHLLDQQLEPFGQRGLAAAHRAEQVEDLLLFLQALRRVAEVGDDVLDDLFHAVELAEGRVDLQHLVGEQARQARIAAGIEQLRLADGKQHALGNAGIGRLVVAAQLEVFLQG